MPSDFRPAERIRNPEAMQRFRLERAGELCERCELRPGAQVHHVILRGQGGDDVEENFEWLCLRCHGEAHGVRYVL